MTWKNELDLLSWNHHPVTVGVDTDGDLGIDDPVGKYSIIIRHDQVEKLKKWLFACGEFKCSTCNGTRRVMVGAQTDDNCPDCKNVPVKPTVQELNALTNKQAETMRKLRIQSVRLDMAMELISEGICRLCDHDPVDEQCPGCSLWRKVCDMREQVSEFCTEYDRLLQDGPFPRSTK